MNNDQLRACTRLMLKASASVNPEALKYLTMSHDKWLRVSPVLPDATTDLRECVRWTTSANTLEVQGRVMEAKADLEHALVHARLIAEANGVDAFAIECLVAERVDHAAS
ncbi:MAG: hypothetical protein BWY79_02150 [Actinobacteria bacterium ADurb.Bin444]|nr:MAG: hypothetical protein BWY79_02150 [Actinobacteria bacterium ADurb.Bin444]